MKRPPRPALGLACLAALGPSLLLAAPAWAQSPPRAWLQAEAPASAAEAAASAAAEAAAVAQAAAAERRLGANSAAELAATGPVAPNPFQLGGYVEAYGQANLNQPSNAITHLRGFDARPGFSIANVALDATWDDGPLIGRLTLQQGLTPATYYLAEPNRLGAGGAATVGAPTFSAIQQAYGGVKLPVGQGLLLTAGTFLSPVGPEAMPIKDNWTLSRSNLFFGLPFYHTGLRAAYPLNDTFTVNAMAINGWNSVVDGNAEKTGALQLTGAFPSGLITSLLYMGGVERPDGAAEGRAWRHLLDAHATYPLRDGTELLLHGNLGAEPNALGTAWWAAGALMGRQRLRSDLFLVLRGDLFRESVPSGGSAIFWPAPWVSSGTLTLDYRPHPRASLRLEARHDLAGAPAFFAGQVLGDGSTANPYQPNASAQTTLSAGVVTWF